MVNLNNTYNPLFLKKEELRIAQELIFFLYKDLDNDINKILKIYKYNKSHFSVIFLASNNYFLTIKDLLSILDIKKQSLSKIINKLKRDDVIYLKTSKKDKRNKNIFLTKKGIRIEKKISQSQINTIATAYKNAGTNSITGFKKVLLNLITNKSKKILGNKTK